jgi:uncharacterized protein with NRDE domain
MCLIGIVWRTHPKHELVLAANRDEFHNRPSAPAAAWKENPQVFGGRDLRKGGSWLAVSSHKRLAAVTNVRRMVPPDPQAPTRGALVAEFVEGSDSAADYARSLEARAADHSAFNLLLYDGTELRFVSNHPDFRDEPMTPGIHTVSNASLDSAWPKSRRLHQALEAWTGESWESFKPLFKALADRTPVADAELPATGMDRALERMLAPPFIVSPHYGTRCSTVVAIGGGKLDFSEKRFGASGLESGHTDYQIALKQN